MTEISIQPNFPAKASPLLLVLFIDTMSLSLIMPILNALIFDPQAHFLPPAISTPFLHNIIYGSSIGIFMVCWFFGATILGDLSDHIGRKKSLSICLWGVIFSYLISALAVSTHSVFLLLLGQAISGITAGSRPIAQAAIIDLSRPDTKARNIGLILFSLSLGFIVGPLLGSLFSDTHLISWFNYSTPFYIAALFSLVNVILLWRLFAETALSSKGKFSFRPSQAITVFISAFRHEKIRNLSVLFFIFIFGWSSFYSFAALFLIKTYSFTLTKLNLFMVLLGVGFGLGTGVLVPYCSQHFPMRHTFFTVTVVAGILLLLMVVVNCAWMSWLLVAPIACCVATAHSIIITIFSDQVDAHSQGWVMGITRSIMAFVWAVNALLIGTLATWSVKLPIYVAGTCLLAVILLGMFYKNREKRLSKVGKRE